MSVDAPNDDVQRIESIPAHEFKRIIHAKGWQMKEVAVRWGMSRVRMSQICNNLPRPLYYDDAVRGLPCRLKS
jgi:hypothetical protein